MSFTVRDSEVDTINVDVWGSEHFVITFYERFLVGDVVEITSPKICIKSGSNETYRPQVTSPFYLSLNEGQSDISIHSEETFCMYLPLLHIPTKAAAGYHGLAEVLQLPEESNNVYVDLLVIVKSVNPSKQIKTRAGVDMMVRNVEIMDNTTPATVSLDMFDIDTIRRAEEWKPLETVLFIADARVSWRSRTVSVQVCARSVITQQPHTAEAEALQLYIRNQADRGGEVAAWTVWSGERACAASVKQFRDRVASGAPFCASLNALLIHLDLDELVKPNEETADELRVQFADHTGELTAKLPIKVLENALGYSVDQLKAMSSDDRALVRWKILLEQCSAKLAASPPRLIVLELRRATVADTIPL